MRAFWKILKRYVAPYRGYVGGSVVMNILSAIFNVFSFSLLIPILKILFNVGDTQYAFTPWHTGMSFGEITSNAYFYVSQAIAQHGQNRVLLWLCLFFIGIVLVKTACYFGAAAVMVPIRTGVVKDLRMELYRKILSLPIGFFSQERKGDIIARISGDVQEVETSITSTIEMLIKNPILIVIYLFVLVMEVSTSWTSPLMRAMMSPFRSWLKKPSGRARILR